MGTRGSIPDSAATQFGSVTDWYQSQDSVMLDSDESGVTYTEVSSPFEGLSDIGSPIRRQEAHNSSSPFEGLSDIGSPI
ncbi:hypothetical protein Tco_1010387 [Tanacetum coccineum]